MKKTAFLFFSLLLLVGLNACKSSQEDVVIIDPMKATFKAGIEGEIFGKKMSFTGNEFGSSVLFKEYADSSQEGEQPEMVAPSVQYIELNKLFFTIYMPSMPSKEYSFDKMQAILSKGAKLPLGTDNLDNFSSVDFKMKKKFVVAFASPDYIMMPENQRKFFSSKGEQKNSQLEVLWSKVIPTPKQYDQRAQVLQVKFKINCQLFWEKEYAGDVKDFEFVANYFYLPL